jgi:hypothetical protein
MKRFAAGQAAGGRGWLGADSNLRRACGDALRLLEAHLPSPPALRSAA